MFVKLLLFRRSLHLSLSLLSASIPVLGYVLVRHGYEQKDIIGLGSIGFCAHLFYFSLYHLKHFRHDIQNPRYLHILILGYVLVGLGVYFFWIEGSWPGVVPLGVGALLTILDYRGSSFRLSYLVTGTPVMLFLLGAFYAELDVSSSPVTISSSLAVFTLGILATFIGNIMHASTPAYRSTPSAGWNKQVISHAKNHWYYVCLLQFVFSTCLASLMVLLHVSWLTALLTCLALSYSALHLRMLLMLQFYEAFLRSRPFLNVYYGYAALLFLGFRWMPSSLQAAILAYSAALAVLPIRLSIQLLRNAFRLTV